MTRRYLYCVHEDNDLHYGDWLMLTRGIGQDPTDHHGEDFSRFPHTKIVRLNNGYGSAGTIPRVQYYADFAKRCANFVQASPECTRWIIGNEPNHAQERPEGQVILPAMYADCYNLCRDAIKALPDHVDDEVLVAAIAPWNIQTEDWLPYFERVQDGIHGCDGFALHTYMREQTPESVLSSERMHPPYEDVFWSFRHYMNWMAAILPQFQGLPCYITEFCVAGEPWKNVDTGCVRQAFQEIYTWNDLNPDKPILCLTMYRWGVDQWDFSDKPNVIQDFNTAVECRYTFPDIDDPTEPPIEPPEENDMLLNPSFEEGWHQQGNGPLVLPDEWATEYLEGGDPWFRPEIKPNQEFVTDGAYSVRAFPPAHSRGFYGIYQEVETEPGQWYRFSADVRTESNPPGKLGAMVGIQPWGGSIFHRQMIWGEEIVNSHDWIRVEVYAQSFGGRIRVVMGADNEFASRNNTTWWDNASLEEWECDGGTDPEPPDPPVGGECKFDKDQMEQTMRRVTREELDRTIWASGTQA